MQSKALALVVGLLSLSNLNGCSNSHAELTRKTSPDGRVDAILEEANGGATTSFAYRVYIVPKGNKAPDKQYAVLTADHQEGLNIAWSENQLLDIQYRTARIFSFKNFWHTSELENWRYMVEIRLRPSQNKSLNETGS